MAAGSSGTPPEQGHWTLALSICDQSDGTTPRLAAKSPATRASGEFAITFTPIGGLHTGNPEQDGLVAVSSTTGRYGWSEDMHESQIIVHRATVEDCGMVAALLRHSSWCSMSGLGQNRKSSMDHGMSGVGGRAEVDLAKAAS